MDITSIGVAGSMESSDISITIEKAETDKTEIFLSSVVKDQYGDQIENVILDTLEKLSVSGVKVRAIDRGALDMTIRARVQAAVFRASEGAEIRWEAL